MNNQYKKLTLCIITSFSSINIYTKQSKKNTTSLSESAQLKQFIKNHKSATAQSTKPIMDNNVLIKPKEEFTNKQSLSRKEKSDKYYSDQAIALSLSQNAQGLTAQPLNNDEIKNFAKLDDADTVIQIKKWLIKHNQQLIADTNENKQKYKNEWRNFISNTEHKVLIDVKSIEKSIKRNNHEIKNLDTKLKRIENSETPEYQRISEHIKRLTYENMIHEESIINLLNMVKVTLDNYDYKFHQNQTNLQNAYNKKNRDFTKSINQILDFKGQSIKLHGKSIRKK